MPATLQPSLVSSPSRTAMGAATTISLGMCWARLDSAPTIIGQVAPRISFLQQATFSFSERAARKANLLTHWRTAAQQTASTTSPLCAGPTGTPHTTRRNSILPKCPPVLIRILIPCQLWEMSEQDKVRCHRPSTLRVGHHGGCHQQFPFRLSAQM